MPLLKRSSAIELAGVSGRTLTTCLVITSPAFMVLPRLAALTLV
jgi:hypothetical protein